MAGSDYFSVSSSFEFPSGSNDSTMRCLNILTIDNGVFEGDETFTVGLTVVTPGVMVGNDETTVTITDNEGKESLSCPKHAEESLSLHILVATVSIPGTVSVGEGDGTAQDLVCATLSLTGSQTAIPISITLATSDGMD